jgi:hypothetical protein
LEGLAIMLADAHREAALDNEETIAHMGDLANWPRANRLVIDGYWGAAFHWIAYGCHQKHGKHKEKHSGLVSYLREFGEGETSTRWEKLENVRNGGWYGHQHLPEDVDEARQLWDEIRTWAQT